MVENQNSESPTAKHAALRYIPVICRISCVESPSFLQFLATVHEAGLKIPRGSNQPRRLCSIKAPWLCGCGAAFFVSVPSTSVPAYRHISPLSRSIPWTMPLTTESKWRRQTWQMTRCPTTHRKRWARQLENRMGWVISLFVPTDY